MGFSTMTAPLELARLGQQMLQLLGQQMLQLLGQLQTQQVTSPLESFLPALLSWLSGLRKPRLSAPNINAGLSTQSQADIDTTAWLHSRILPHAVDTHQTLKSNFESAFVEE